MKLHRLQEEIPLTFVVNPKITLLQPQSEWEADYESCESIPNYNALVYRSNTVTINGWDLNGAPLQFDAEGVVARIIQHEYDHLQGILYVDKMIQKTFRHDEYIDEYDQYVRKRSA
jgi:peptide deformylase